MAHEAPHHFGGRIAGGDGGGDEVGQALLAEELPVRGAGFGDAVGVEQQAVPGLQAGFAAVGFGVLQAQRPVGGQGGGRTRKEPRRISGAGCPALIQRSRPVSRSRRARTAVANWLAPNWPAMVSLTSRAISGRSAMLRRAWR